MSNGIWNMDLHDKNILIDPISSKVTVIDFGIAKDSAHHALKNYTPQEITIEKNSNLTG